MRMSTSGMVLSTPSKIGRRAASIRNMLSCRYASGDVDTSAAGDVMMEDIGVAMMQAADPLTISVRNALALSQRAALAPTPLRRYTPPKRAILVLKSRKHNEPIVRVRQGTVRLRNLDLVHNASGTDIWNGNAAVQIQPPFDAQDIPLTAITPSITPTAIVDRVDIASASGRGIVNIDGGFVTVRDCYIHNCAATGIYIGGPGSVAKIERTDVTQNGNGNVRSRRGIARGHSGVYLEQGVASLMDCNISDNSLTGISAISSENATLTVADSDLAGNGTLQLEMPPLGSASNRKCVSRNNTISSQGKGRSRSGLVPPPPRSPNEEVAEGGARSVLSSDGQTMPQSPVEDDNSIRRRTRFAAMGNEDNLVPAAPLVN